jgi:hypothetical protein
VSRNGDGDEAALARGRSRLSLRAVAPKYGGRPGRLRRTMLGRGRRRVTVPQRSRRAGVLPLLQPIVSLRRRRMHRAEPARELGCRLQAGVPVLTSMYRVTAAGVVETTTVSEVMIRTISTVETQAAAAALFTTAASTAADARASGRHTNEQSRTTTL